MPLNGSYFNLVRFINSLERSPRFFVVKEIGLNRALAVKRTDPEDDTPVNRRLIPLPGAAYRWKAR